MECKQSSQPVLITAHHTPTFQHVHFSSYLDPWGTLCRVLMSTHVLRLVKFRHNKYSKHGQVHENMSDALSFSTNCTWWEHGLVWMRTGCVCARPSAPLVASCLLKACCANWWQLCIAPPRIGSAHSWSEKSGYLRFGLLFQPLWVFLNPLNLI